MKLDTNFPPPIQPEEFIRLLTRARLAVGNNTQQLADDLGIARSSIDRWLRTHNTPSQWYWRTALLATLRIYKKAHLDFLDQHPRDSYRRQQSITILHKLRSIE